MDGMNLIPDTAANERYHQIAALLMAEWDLIKPMGNKALTMAHSRLHYALAGLAAELGVPSGVQTDSGGGDKPPQPS